MRGLSAEGGGQGLKRKVAGFVGERGEGVVVLKEDQEKGGKVSCSCKEIYLGGVGKCAGKAAGGEGGRI